MRIVKKVLQKTLASIGLELFKHGTLLKYQQELDALRYNHERCERDRASLELLPRFAHLWNKLDADQKYLIARYLPFSMSQLAQDLFVLSEFAGQPSSNFFVEFGGADGILHSNTYLLESHLGWSGIVAEPARTWHSQLRKNRTCVLDFRCVDDISHKVIEFMEVSSQASNELFNATELSCIASYAQNHDWASQIRLQNSTCYHVETVSLNDLLSAHDAPNEIGYLSIDTEGSEFSILERFDFSKYTIRVITVEHNYNDNVRKCIHSLLLSNGYIHKYSDISLWDDWYVLP